MVIEEVSRSGLRGRGGGGFPTGKKWSFVRLAEGEEKYVICNADEGDPGAFMDRAVLEGDPHAVLEGMLIAAYAVGANKGYIYVRAEYPLAIERLRVAIVQARERGYLGEGILGSGFSFDVELRMGAGSFVCGEETALIASIEGKRGMPRPKPPFPAQEGLWGKPTLINNVETLANVRHIILRGAEWFRSIGTEKSPGTKVFALSGKVRNTGLVEVPMGTTLGEIVFDIGGGIPERKRFKAAQIGGPSGGVLTSEHLNLPLDYESVAAAGAIVGSGGLIVLDEDDCMVNLAKFFLEYCQEESCGKCVPCRIGTKEMLNILERITKGEGKAGDIEELERMGKLIKETALCGLGQTAPNPVLSTIRYFRKEYEEHIVGKKCEAGVCAALFYAPCSNACPAGVDVSRYMAHMAEGRFEEAFRVHMERNPFPSICGRVCPAFCESKCERGKFDEAIAIREVKRVFADWAAGSGIKFAPPEEVKPRKVAIVGAGPAGLTCAFYLTRLGYRPVVFEALPFAGGMMRVGIPDFRLPKDVLDSEIRRIEEAGVEIRLNTPVDSVRSLREQGFDAIFVGIGAFEPKKMGIEGEGLKGVEYGLDFLRKVNMGERFDLSGKKVAVIGGGSTATDAARVALRLGAEEVKLVYRRTELEMPALAEEIRDAKAEGVEFEFLTLPVAFEGNGSLERVKCVRMKLRGFDGSGRRKPVKEEGSEFYIDADLAVICIGQEARLGGFADELRHDGRGKLIVDEDTLQTNIEGVFAGGDVLVPSTVVESVAHGRRAAVMIDRYLGYDGKFNYPERVEVRTSYDESAYERQIPRKQPIVQDVEERLRGFVEVNKGLLVADAIEEAKRCLHCDRGKEIWKGDRDA